MRKRAKLLLPKVASPMITGDVYLDMDGVTADYERGGREEGYTPDQWLNVPGAFRNLPLMPGAEEAITKLQRLAPGRVKFLSKPADRRWKESCIEKREWMAEHFPSIPPEHILLVKDKSKVGKPGDGLVDDHPTWNGADKFKGLVIHFTGPHCWDQVFDAVKRGNERLPKAVNE